MYPEGTQAGSDQSFSLQPSLRHCYVMCGAILHWLERTDTAHEEKLTHCFRLHYIAGNNYNSHETFKHWTHLGTSVLTRTIFKLYGLFNL